MKRASLLAVLFAGVLLGALDIAIVGPALPAIQQSFDVDGSRLSWVFSVYILFYIVGAPLLGKLSDLRGRRTVFVGCVGLFGLGSVLVAAAPSFAALLSGRAVQALGAGGIFPVASAVVGESFPAERRGRALGMLGAVFGIAFIIGPVLGGVLLRLGWQWLFLINLPLVAAVIVGALRALPAEVSRAAPPFDRARAGALVRSRQLRIVGVIAVAAGLVEAALVFLPVMSVQAFGVTPSAASFMLLPLVATLLVGAPMAGRLLDAIGPKPVIQAGLVLTVVGLAAFGLFPPTLASFYAAGVCVGLGLSALLGAPLRYVVLEESGERRRGMGQGLLTLCLSIGQLAGAALVGAVVASGASELAGYRDALLYLAAVCAAAGTASIALEGRGAPRQWLQ